MCKKHTSSRANDETSTTQDDSSDIKDTTVLISTLKGTPKPEVM